MTSEATFWKRWLAEVSLALGAKLTHDNLVTVMVDAPEFVPAMLDSIRKSQKSVSFQFYGMEADAGGYPFAQALIDAAQRGVSVKVILDFVEMFLETNGRWSFLPFQSKEIREERRATQKMLKEMRRAGIDIYGYGWKYGLHRNHSKSLIADNEVLFTGGFNPTAHNCRWHEVSARTYGPVVREAQRKFNDVFEQSGRVGIDPGPLRKVSSGAQGVSCSAAVIFNRPIKGHFESRRFLLAALEEARSSILIENGYVSHPDVIQALIKAKQRGVRKVQLIVPAKSNHPGVDRKFRRQISQLLRHGIEVFFYPGMTHAKVMSIDDTLVSIGSTNLETFSLQFQNELDLVAVDPNGELGRQVRERIFDRDIQKSISGNEDVNGKSSSLSISTQPFRRG